MRYFMAIFSAILMAKNFACLTAGSKYSPDFKTTDKKQAVKKAMQYALLFKLKI